MITGIADLRGDLLRPRDVGDRAVRAGHQRQAELAGGALGLDLVAHRADVLGLGADPDDVVRSRRSRRTGRSRRGSRSRDGSRRRRLISAAEMIAGDVEIAVRRRRRADADRVVGQPDVHRVGVGGRMHRDRLDAHLVAGAVDAQRDLAAVGDQELRDRHAAHSMTIERLVELDRLAVLDQDLLAPCRRWWR